MWEGSLDAFEVIKPGLLTTVQDLGRIGYQRYGVPTSGAMDRTALRVANLLLDNGEGFAGLEATAEGPTLRALLDLVIAIVGADMRPLVDGRPIACGTTVRIRRGQIVELQCARQGLRAYVAVAGGIDVPMMLGSRSTCLPAAFGGFHGRSLRLGDRLALGSVDHQPHAVGGRRLPPGWLEPIGEVLTVRVVLGLQEDCFTPEGIRTFLSEGYRVTPQIDRMGARLQGPPIVHRSGADIVSDSTPLGAIQVASDGQPMIVLADRQTTGGYTKIAVVVQEDVCRLGQAVPGQIVRFRQVSRPEACAVLKSYYERFGALQRAWQSQAEASNCYWLRLETGPYRVAVEDGSATFRVRVEGVNRKSDDVE